ncbi:LRR receptor-like serine/threonine-protein kinase FLS2 [Senna tora]|uniref:LRR receptor-like serine/threonine-protein kinase FLS2 n=1 Tax=Senna tora TaxID=362788 RepID=A0A834SUM4_9FABA|nr:LRR receptor-like serine/threonine-protein kinase FLS2 [Senna tora]
MKMGWDNLVVLVGVIVVLHAEVMRKSMGIWLEDEKRALVDIKHSLFVQNASLGHPLLPSWDVSDPKSDSCKWEGVLCHSSSGHLITLSLSNLPATTLDDGYYMDCPDSMSLNMSLFLPFHQLATLNLSINCFHHLFAIQDGQSESTLSMLESLDLSWNPHLNESIIKSLTALTSLKNLNIARCDMSGPFPIQDGGISNSTFPMLETLDLSHNYDLEESSVINFLSALTSLKNLNLANCSISGPFLMQDGGSNSTFSMLENLDLTGNQYLNWTIIKFLTAFTSLKTLNLIDCNMNGPFPIQELSVLRNLDVLNLSHNLLRSPSSTFQDVHLLSNLTKLRILDLSRNQVDKSIFKYLIALPTLKSLFLSGNYQGMNGILIHTDLCKMKELQELDLSNNDLTGTLDACLANLTSLRALDLSSNSLSGSISGSLVAHLVHLEYLSLSNNKFEGSFSLNFLANNSKLKVLSLGPMNNSKTFQVETENPPNWIPSFQLEYLGMPSCQVNLLSRTIPTFLLYQHALKYVDLSKNNLVGTFPFWLLVNNSRSLTSVLLDGNSFVEFHLPSHLNQPFDQLVFLNLSNNKFQGNLPRNIGYFLHRLEYLDVSRNMFDGDIPISIGEMSYLKSLDLSNNNFSGKIPKDILIRCIDLTDLRLSHNSLQGSIFPTPMNLGYFEVFLVNNNQFNGTLLKDGVSISGWVVDISSNKLSGMLPSWIAKSSDMLSVSRNNFEGEIPVDLCKTDFLTILDLSHNRFSGTIPSCLFNLSSLRLIDLGSNNLTGTIPEASRDSSFGIIDLSNNQLSGSIPKSFYKHSPLAILSLAKNKLEGQLSSEICELQQINILDLSHNKFTGSIPSCFNNMSFGLYPLVSNFEGFESSGNRGYYYNSHFWFNAPENTYWLSFGEDEVQLVTKSISLSYKGDGLMSGLDLSSNQLMGGIPEQIGDLHALHALNLSHNHLNGTIPESFRKMIQMESLDLSSNNLIGGIPMQLQDLTFLSTFNVCYNNLSGRAPDQGQFANFDESNYKGNPYLSWSDSNRRKETPSETPLKNSTEGSECFIDLTAFYWSFGASYVMVILTLVTILWINPRWRNVCRVFKHPKKKHACPSLFLVRVPVCMW